ncbi:hypothetical protein [Helicobacter vulpis]|uniref:hypothetical protein n=1 Tax=Helicobacter vulpis TaxID=2316076 RepID=UPI000EB3CEB7|nr:hypothetical protein [Helicobacter vulpis]
MENKEKKTLAIFVDWENLRIELESIQRHHAEFGEQFFRFNDQVHLRAFFAAFVEDDEQLMEDKIFFIRLHSSKGMGGADSRSQSRWLQARKL